MPLERRLDPVHPREPQHPWRRLGLAGIALFLGGAVAFALRPQVLDAADAWVFGAGGQAGILLATVLGHAGNILAVGAALVLACALLARQGRIAAAVALVLAFLLQEGVVHSLKILVERPRPEWAIMAAPGWSFPSGHAARGALMAAMLVALLPAARTRLLVLGAILFALLMAAARVVLGVHHVSDVIAGAGIGLASAGFGVTALLAYEARRDTTRVPVEEPVEAVQEA